MEHGAIPEVPVYVDSPMAIDTTELYLQHPGYHKLAGEELSNGSIFNYNQIKYCRKQEASKSLNNLQKHAVIISASGMCTGGRILHHLSERLPRPNDTLLFVGYQAEGTRGRRILDGESSSKIFGINVPVKCHIERLEGLSAHADKGELLRWLQNFTTHPKITFIIHGEEKSSNALQETLKDDLGWQNIFVPQYLESFVLFEGI